LLQKELTNFQKYGDRNAANAAELAGECPNDDIKCYRENLSKAYGFINDEYIYHQDYNGVFTKIHTPKKDIYKRNELVKFLKTL
jgi:hypothetical protein